ncbi:hypothetical protein LCGC14_2908210, partial [marine sediment metagenome]
IDTVLAGGDGGTATINLNYADTLAANPTFAAKECVFTIEGTSGGGFLCEGSVGGNSNEQLYLFPALDGVDTTTFIALGASDGDALAGDSATSFFDIGTLELAIIPDGTANQILGTDAAGTAAEHKSLASDETGTDFGITHTANTVTFNWPIASATNTGKLSNTNWTTFNNKEDDAHASEHQNGGGDEVATATAAANAIPKANASADLAPAWVITGATTASRCLRTDGSSNIVVDSTDCGGGSGTWIGLSDTPGSFTTLAFYVTNSGASALVVSSLTEDADSINSSKAIEAPSFTGTGTDHYIQLPNWTTPTIGDASTGRIVYESASQRLRASLNTAAFSDIALASDDLSLFSATTIIQLATLLSDEDFTPGSEASAEGVLDLPD